MLSIVIASKNSSDLERCKASIAETIGVPYEIIVTENSEGKIPLTKVYNDGAQKAKYETLLFVHEDAEFKKKEWGKKIIETFRRKDIGLIGVVGSVYFPENGAWASPGVPFLRGRMIHPSRNIEIDQIDLFSEEMGDFEVVAIDGVFMATRKEIVEEIPFDEQTFNGFHFYDADFSLRVAQRYKVIVTTDILLKHYSHGKHDEVWNKYKEKFVQKHKAILPFTNQKGKPDWNHIKEWRVKYLLYKKEGKLVSKQ